MKKIYLILLLLVFITNTHAQNACILVCGSGFEERVTNIEKKIIDQMSQYLAPQEHLAETKDNIIYSLRDYNCQLDSLYEGIIYAYDLHLKTNYKLSFQEKCTSEQNRDTTICLSDFQSAHSCQSIKDSAEMYSYYKKEDFFGEKPICKFYTSSSKDYLNAQVECKKYLALKKKQMLNFVNIETSVSSAQSSSNYYSAKLLDLSQRLKILGDHFLNLNKKMSQVYKDIKCNCQK